ncbi:hypothetical protein QYF36_009095 [Acer negundo]|nr:hypothetical protein QYF36_009095 [Acer negundo]
MGRDLGDSMDIYQVLSTKLLYLLVLLGDKANCPQNQYRVHQNIYSSSAYPTLCFASLASRATLIQTSPKLLAHAALNVTLSTAKSTSIAMLHLSKNPGTKPREEEAMQDYLEELSDSVDEVRRSIAEMGQIKSLNFQLTVSDIQTWVSAALTDETTCSDGFDGKTKNGKVVRERILNIAHLTSNALALINSYASLHA